MLIPNLVFHFIVLNRLLGTFEFIVANNTVAILFGIFIRKTLTVTDRAKIVQKLNYRKGRPENIELPNMYHDLAKVKLPVRR